MEVGSIPTGCTKYAPMVELVDTVVLEATASASEFESRLGHQYVVVMELVYISDLKSEFCGFESHLPHHEAPVDKLAKSFLSKGKILSVRLRAGVPVIM